MTKPPTDAEVEAVLQRLEADSCGALHGGDGGEGMSKPCKHRKAWPTVWSHPHDHGFYWCPCCGAVRLLDGDGWIRPVGFHLLAGREMPLDARPDLKDLDRREGK